MDFEDYAGLEGVGDFVAGELDVGEEEQLAVVRVAEGCRGEGKDERGMLGGIEAAWARRGRRRRDLRVSSLTAR